MLKFGSFVVSILASLNMEMAFAQVGTEEVFTLPQSCFGHGTMGETSKAKSDLADETNIEELFTSAFQYDMRPSKVTMCHTTAFGLYGVQLELTAPLTEDDDEPRVLTLAPIGNVQEDDETCYTQEIEEGGSIDVMTIYSGDKIN